VHGDPALEERDSPEPFQTNETSALGDARLPRPVRDLIFALGLVAAIGISCPWGQRLPSSGLDQGWMLGLTWARDTHLHFGSDVLFTYGPWGWLTAPVLLHSGSLIAAGLFSLGAVLALWWAVTSSLMDVGRGVLGTCFAVVVGAMATPLVFAATGPSWTLAVALFCMGLRCVAAERGPATALLVAVSLCAALLLQVKFSEGALVSSLWLLLLARSMSRRSLMIGTSTFIGAFIAFWMTAGQALGDLGRWFVGSWQLTVGYPDAMQLGGMSPRVMTAGFLTGALLLLTLIDGRDRTRSVLWSMLLTMGLLVFAGKQAFTRQDDLHSVAFFSAVVAVGVQASCRPRLQLCRRLILGVSLLSVVVSGVTSDARLQRLGWRETSSLLTHAIPLETRLDQARDAMRLDYAVSGHVLSRIGDRPVAVDPYEVGAAWAYDLNWSPVPVLQPYSAYEPELDAMNAAHLLATPRMAVLREESVIDGRLQLWDSPRYNMALLCSFREADHDARWTVFLRDANRCSPAGRRASVVVSAGMPVRVPAARPGTIVTMSFAPDGEYLGRGLVSALTHRSALEVTLGDDNYRLPRALAGGPLIARLPADVRWPTRPQGRPEAATVTFNVRGTVTFSTVRLHHPD
jgi:hypothetical protein